MTWRTGITAVPRDSACIEPPKKGVEDQKKQKKKEKEQEKNQNKRCAQHRSIVGTGQRVCTGNLSPTRAHPNDIPSPFPFRTGWERDACDGEQKGSIP